MAHLDRTLDRAVAISAVVFGVLVVWATLTPRGEALPVVPEILLATSLSVMLLGHMANHLGVRLMAGFVLTAASVEWVFEQTNITFGGFIWGDLRYGDVALFEPHIGSVPVAVPLLMAVILWPTYACVNLLLDGRVVVDLRGQPMPMVLWRCVLYGMVHSWWMFLCNTLCVERGLYSWTGSSQDLLPADGYFGDPAAPLGWTIYVVVVMLPFTLVVLPRLGRDRLALEAARPLVWPDIVPAYFLGAIAVLFYLNPLDRTTGNVVFWTIGFFALLVGYRFVRLMTDRSVTTTTKEPA